MEKVQCEHFPECNLRGNQSHYCPGTKDESGDAICAKAGQVAVYHHFRGNSSPKGRVYVYDSTDWELNGPWLLSTPSFKSKDLPMLFQSVIDLIG